MVCIHCSGKTQVVNSRSQLRVNSIWRRRKCLSCGIIFSTREEADRSSIWSVKDRTGQLEPFERDKLFLSLHKSCQHRISAVTDASGLTQSIIMKLNNYAENGIINAQAIIQVSQVALSRFDKASSVHYQAFHQK
jgi:transcriptional regulator NrdR family protein